jgi:PAS domain S-box-containing protein
MILRGTHDLTLVLISYLVALMAAYAIIELSAQVAARRTSERRLWIVLGSITLGIGVWGTQCLGLLAYRLPVPTTFAPGRMALALVPAVGGILVAFWAVSRRTASWRSYVVAGLLISLAKAVMQYLGLAAMTTAGEITLQPAVFVVSILATVGAAAGILSWLFRRRLEHLQRLGAAFVLATLIAGLHYAGMLAVRVELPVGVDLSPVARSSSAFWPAAGVAFVVAVATLSTLFLSTLIQRGRTRLVQLIVVQAILALGAVTACFVELTLSGAASQRERLRDQVGDGIAMLDLAQATSGGRRGGERWPAGVATLAGDRFGASGEIVVAVREGDVFVFPYSQRPPVPVGGSQTALLIARALAGESGTTTAFDPGGGQVLVAFGASHQTGVAVLAKIDSAEIREPFLRAGIFAGAASLVLVFLGTLVLVRIGNPLIVEADAGAYLRAVIDSAPLPMMVESADGRILQVNRGWDRYLGFDGRELVGRERRAVLQGALGGAVDVLSRRAREDGSAVGEVVAVTAVGRTPFRVAVAAAAGLAEGAMIWIAEDLAERRRAEERVELSERRFRTIFETAPVAIFVEDFSAIVAELEALRASGVNDLRRYVSDNPGFAEHALGLIRITDFNLAAARMHGALDKAQLREAIGTLFTDEGKGILVEELTALFEHRSHFEAETSFRRLDGEIGHAVINMRLPREGEQGDDVLVSLLDVTAQVASREAHERARQAAEDMALAKSQFLANMSHEIRTPMNGVMGMLGLLLDSDMSEHQRELAITAYSAAESLLGILNDILDVSKIEAGRLEVESIPFDPARELGAAARVLATRAAERRNELHVDVGAAVPRWVSGDPGRLRQVVTNLLSNAIKFTEDGEILLTVAASETPGPRTRLRIAVRDTGVGIAPDKLDTIFQEFSQADPSVTRTHGGTGLGLTISRRLVELMGSRLQVRSELGRGSEFWFELECEEAPGASPALPAGLDLGGRRFLVVDDTATARRIVRQALESVGGRVVEARSADEALALLRAPDAALPDVAIIDTVLPGRDGFALAEAVSGDSRLAAIRLMMLTSSAEPGAHGRARETGIGAYLTKPVNRIDLMDGLCSLLRPHEAGEAARRPLVTEGSIEIERRRLRILLAEDNGVNRRIAVSLLEKMGHTVDLAVNGIEAVDKASREEYDLVFMDIQMPMMDGLEATRRIRRLPSGASVPIVALTAHALTEERQRCEEAGMNGFVTKPFKPLQLRSAIDEALV